MDPPSSCLQPSTPVVVLLMLHIVLKNVVTFIQQRASGTVPKRSMCCLNWTHLMKTRVCEEKEQTWLRMGTCILHLGE